MLREQIRSHKILFELGQPITSEMNLEALFELIMHQTNQLMDTERCSVFLFDAEEKQLWSLVSTDPAKNEVRIPATHGVAGWGNMDPVPRLGVAVTPENQQMIFGGFFHTLETNFYSSKRPYEFNAGGSGSDLLRTKCFSERYGFTVDFESTRRKFIPNDRDLCPARISKCKSITDPSECLSSGESAFVHSAVRGVMSARVREGCMEACQDLLQRRKSNLREGARSLVGAFRKSQNR